MANDARNFRARPMMGQAKPLKSLSSVTVTGATGAVILQLPHPTREFTVQLDKLVTGTTHASTKAVVALQGKLSTGTTWFALGSAFNITSSGAVLSRSTNSKGVMFARLSVTSFTTVAATSATDKANVTGYIVGIPGV